MTARTERYEPPMCSVMGCGLHACARISVVLPVTTQAKGRDELELAMPLFVCEYHQANPPTTAADYVSDPESQERLRLAVAALGYVEPQFEGVRLHYSPLPPMSKQGAH